MPFAESISASFLVNALNDCGVDDVVIVPDTHQRTVIEYLTTYDDIRLIQSSTEDEALAICAGLIIGGRRPILQIQHAGLFACVNNLRGIGIDGRVPIVLLVGLLGRDANKLPRDNFGSMVRYTEPILEALGIPFFNLERKNDISMISKAFDKSEQCQGPVAVLVGEETS